MLHQQLESFVRSGLSLAFHDGYVDRFSRCRICVRSRARPSSLRGTDCRLAEKCESCAESFSLVRVEVARSNAFAKGNRYEASVIRASLIVR